MRGQSMRDKQARGWAAYDDVWIALTRFERVRTSDGGYELVQTYVRPRQLFGLASVRDDDVSRAYDGKALKLELMLVGAVGADIKVDDRLTYDGIPMRVNAVSSRYDGTYAEVVRYG